MQFDIATLVNALSIGQQPPIVAIYVASISVLLVLVVASVKFRAAPRFAWVAFLILAAIVLASLLLLFSGTSTHIVN